MELYPRVCLEWKEIYNLPFKVLNDPKLRDFQYKILNRYLTMNAFLYKTGLRASPLSAFCGAESESLEHLLITCPFTNDFWLDFICWCRNVNIILDGLFNIDKLFGICNREEDFLLLNHLLIIATCKTTSMNAAKIALPSPLECIVKPWLIMCTN